MRVLAWSSAGESSLPSFQKASFSLCFLREGERERERQRERERERDREREKERSLLSLLIKALIPS